MRKLLSLITIGFTAFFVAHGAAMAKEDTPPTLDGATVISAEQAIELIGSIDNLVVVDARKDSDHQKGWIEGSKALPNTETNPDSLAKVVPDKAQPVLFYCNGIKCGRSYESAKVALAAGYSKVYWFRGGMEEWEAKGLPVVKE
jgi:rhodanese-related sulfurtransferase